MMQVIERGAFSSPTFTAKAPKILARDFSADFTLSLLRKDQDLVLAEARRLGYAMPTEEAVRAVIEQAISSGLGEMDFSALYLWFLGQGQVNS
jgi:3-hydroxyisobutyrate dehydrogenase